MPEKKNYISYTHNTSSISTIQDLVNGGDSTTICYGWDELALLAYQDENGEANLEKIWKKYNAKEKIFYEKAYIFDKNLVNNINNPESNTNPPIASLENEKKYTIYPDPSGDQNWKYEYRENGWWAFNSILFPQGIPLDKELDKYYVDKLKFAYPTAATDNDPNQSLTLKVKTKIQLSLLKLGTELILPKNKINVEAYSQLSNQIVTGISQQAFISNALRDLLDDPDYKPIVKNLNKGYASYKSNFPNCTVWIWCRALSHPPIDWDAVNDPTGSTDKELLGTIINVSPFIESISTTQSSNGGNFNITLAPLICSWSKEKGYLLKRTEKAYVDGGINYLSENSLLREGENNSLKRNSFYFSTILGENDLVFIRFETLKNEVIENNKELNKGKRKDRKKYKNRLLTEDNLIIDKDQLPGQIYDMIGLIDNNNQTLSPSEANISISGRDLYKLFTDDGCYFYPSDFVPGGIFANETDQDYLDRIDGKLVSLCQYAFKSIDFTLKFIINNLSKIKICPDNLFEAYGDDVKNSEGEVIKLGRSKTFRLDIESKKAIFSAKTELEKKKEETLKMIHGGRLEDKLTKIQTIETADSTCFYLLKDFIKFLKKNNFLNYSPISFNWVIPIIPSSTQNIEYSPPLSENKETLKTNIFPSFFNELFFKTKGEWVDLNNSGIKWEDSEYKIAYEQVYSPLAQYLSDEDIKQNEIESLDISLDKYVKTLIERADEKEFQNPAVKEFSAALSVWVDDLKNNEEKWVFKKEPKLISQLNEYQYKTLSNIYELYIEEEKNENYKGEYEEKNMKGIWQIVKLLIDSSGDFDSINPDNPENIYAKYSGSLIGRRRIVDSTIGNENGSLMNSIKKICQEPFVEFTGDTIGDQYFFMVRQPPFTYNDYLSIIDKNHYITIEEEDIINSNLSFENGSAYSWYRLEPKNLMEDLGQEAVTAYLKAVHFKEIADIFGEKPLEIVSNYLDFHPFIGTEGELSINSIMQQAVNDLNFIMDTHVHLPFTRSGNITINGDRRIKKGTFVYIKSTDELFYVESVTNSLSIAGSKIERTTQIQVSRGLIVEDADRLFNLILREFVNVSSSSSSSDDYLTYLKKTYGNLKIDKFYLNYFLQRRQFIPKEDRATKTPTVRIGVNF